MKIVKVLSHFHLMLSRLSSRLNFSAQIPYLLISATLFVAYFPNLSQNYAWSDDYPAMISPEDATLHMLKDLRPLHGLIVSIFFGAFNSLSSLWIIRFLGLSILIIIANLSYKFIQESVLNKKLALCLVVVIYQSPPLLFSVYWAMGTTTMLFSLILSIFAYRYHLRRRFLLGFFLLTLSFLIYPLGTWAGLSIFILSNILANTQMKALLAFMKSAVLFTIPSALSAILIGFLVLKLIGEAPNRRTQIQDSYNLSESFLWLLTRMIPQSFRPFLVSSPSNITAVIQVFILVVILLLALAIKNSLQESIRIFLQLLLVVLFLLLPGFLLGYNQIEPRFFVGTSVVVIGVLLSSIYKLLFFKDNGGLHPSLKSMSNLLLCLVIVFSVFFNRSFFDKHVISVYTETKTFVSGQIEKCDNLSSDTEFFVNERTRPWEGRPYLGMLSQVTDLASPWVPSNAVLVLLPQGIVKGATIQIGKILPPEAASDICIINLDDFDSKN